MTLDQQLAALCADHDLCSLSVQAYKRDDGTVWFGAYAQAIQGADRLCGSDEYADKSSASYALRSAIENLNALRVKAVSVPELEQAA